MIVPVGSNVDRLGPAEDATGDGLQPIPDPLREVVDTARRNVEAPMHVEIVGATGLHGREWHTVTRIFEGV